MTRHIHADLIHAWAEGVKIQIFVVVTQEWKDIDNTSWDKTRKYRIKPEESKAPVVRWKWGYLDGGLWYETDAFRTEEEVKLFPDPDVYIKLDYTRTEFPE